MARTVYAGGTMQTLLIVGIGNPDPEYQDTRHNIGFTVLDRLVKKLKCDDLALDKKCNALVAECSATVRGKRTKLVLAKPLSYVNASGSVVIKLKTRTKVKPEHIFVIQDDLDIPFGHTKLSFDKHSGGHKGIESIIKALKTAKFYRLRIGTATRSLTKARQQSDKRRDEWVRDFVLSKFTSAERDQLKDIFKDSLAKLGIEA